MLYDTTRDQAALILETDGLPINSTSLVNDNKEGPLVENYVFRSFNPLDTRGSAYRSYYNIEFTDGLATSIIYRNIRLANYAVNTLGHLNEYSFSNGMSYEAAVKTVGVLPSAAECNLTTLVLYFGQEIRHEGISSYPLKLIFTLSNKQLYRAEFYETPAINPPANTEISEEKA
jgi:hypothetical protein